MSKTDLGSFKKHSLIYLVGELFNKGILIISIPLFTYLLSAAEYGKLSVFISLINIATVFMGMNFYTALARRYHEDSDDFPEYLKILFWLFTIVVLAFLFATLLFYQEILLLTKLTKDAFFLVIPISILMSYLSFYMAYLQTSQNSKKYVTVSFFKNVASLILGVIIILTLKDNKYLGKVYADLTVLTVISIFVVYQIFQITKGVKTKKDQVLSYIKYTLKVCLPMFPITLSGLFLLQADIIILNYFVEDVDVGIYSLAYNLSMIVVIFFTALNNAWIPIFYRLKLDGKNQEISDRLSFYIKLVCLLALAMILFNKYILLFLDDVYSTAAPVISIIVLGFVFAYINSLILSYGIFRKKLISFSLVSIFCALLNLGLNIYLIPIYGLFAAAYSTLFTYATLCALYLLILRFYLKEVISVSKDIIYLLLFMLVVTLINQSLLKFAGLWLSLFLSFPLIMFFIYIFLGKDLKTLWNTK